MHFAPPSLNMANYMLTSKLRWFNRDIFNVFFSREQHWLQIGIGLVALQDAIWHFFVQGFGEDTCGGGGEI